MCAIEADKGHSLAFYTLTYNDTWLPICRTQYVPEIHDNAIVSRERGDSCYPWQLKEWSQNGCSVQPDDDGDFVCPSLYREDVKCWMKRFRSYLDSKGLPKDFSFACFGEYGELKRRPHFHVLVAGLDSESCNVLANKWTYGFCDLKHIPRFNNDGSDAFVLVSNYVSKYIAKKDKLPDFVKRGFAEKPRRQTSLGFGALKDEDIEHLRPFLSCRELQTPSGHCPISGNY